MRGSRATWALSAAVPTGQFRKQARPARRCSVARRLQLEALQPALVSVPEGQREGFQPTVPARGHEARCAAIRPENWHFRFRGHSLVFLDCESEREEKSEEQTRRARRQWQWIQSFRPWLRQPREKGEF